MQNNVIVFTLALFLRLLRNGLKLVARMFVFQPERAARPGMGAFLLSVDLDSARLDAVSRSLLWGSGIPVPEPARTAGSSPTSGPRPLHWHGPGPEPFHLRDT
jgi:hypothetical protein